MPRFSSGLVTTFAWLVGIVLVMNFAGSRLMDRDARLERERWERVDALRKRSPPPAPLLRETPPSPPGRLIPLQPVLPDTPVEREYVDSATSIEIFGYRGRVKAVAGAKAGATAGAKAGAKAPIKAAPMPLVRIKGQPTFTIKTQSKGHNLAKGKH